MEETRKSIAIQYELLAVEDAKLREQLAAVETQKARLRVRLAELGD
jgi:hypothetical protein